MEKAAPIQRMCRETAQMFWTTNANALFCSKEAQAAYRAREAANRAA